MEAEFVLKYDPFLDDIIQVACLILIKFFSQVGRNSEPMDILNWSPWRLSCKLTPLRLSLLYSRVLSYICVINLVINLILSRDGKNLITKFSLF